MCFGATSRPVAAPASRDLDLIAGRGPSHADCTEVRDLIEGTRYAWGRPDEIVVRMEVHSSEGVAKVSAVQVVLRKLGRGSRAVTGRLVRAPRKGSVVVIEFSDGMHEYVTTPVKRVLRLAPRDVFYIETVNSRYRLEVQGSERSLDDASSG